MKNSLLLPRHEPRKVEAICCTKHDMLRREAEARGAQTAQRASVEFQTTDAFTIAKRAGIKIIRERWPLVTIGEYEPRTRTIRVNLAALEQARGAKDQRLIGLLEQAIVAHELGHMFNVHARDSTIDKQTRRLIAEQAAHGFAANLLGIHSKDLRAMITDLLNEESEIS